jgi:hypothetical protein
MGREKISVIDSDLEVFNPGIDVKLTCENSE